MTTAIAAVSYPDTTRTDVTTRTRRSLVTVGLAAGAAAAATNMVIAAAALGVDVSLKVSGSGATPQPIPVGGFASMTLLGAVIGILMAAGVSRWSHKPATRFVQLSVVGTALSLVPSVLSAADAATLVVLFVTHLTAAIIIVTTLSRRLQARGQN